MAMTQEKAQRGALAAATSNMHLGFTESKTTHALTHYAAPSEVIDLNFQIRAAKRQQHNSALQKKDDTDLLWNHYRAQERGRDDFHTGFMEYNSRTLWTLPQKLGEEQSLELLSNMVRLKNKGQHAMEHAASSRKEQAEHLREASQYAVRIARAEAEKEKAEQIISESTTIGRRTLGEEMKASAVADIDKYSELRHSGLVQAALKANTAATMEEVVSSPEKQPDAVYKTKRQPTRVGVSTLTTMMTRGEEMFHDVSTGSTLSSCKLHLDSLEARIDADTNGDGTVDEFEEANMAERVSPETWRELAQLHTRVVNVLHAETDTGRQYSAPHHKEANRLLERMAALRAGHVRA